MNRVDRHFFPRFFQLLCVLPLLVSEYPPAAEPPWGHTCTLRSAQGSHRTCLSFETCCPPGYYFSSCNADKNYSGINPTCQPCGTCLHGQIMMECLGNTSRNSFRCIDCPAGSYAAGLTTSVCSLCPAGSYSAVRKSNSSKFCLPCPPGSYSDLNGSSACTLCENGKFTIASRAGGFTSCLQEEMRHSHRTDLNSSAMKNNNNSVDVFKGSRRSLLSVTCPAGQYRDVYWNWVWNGWKWTETEFTRCVICLPGKYSSQQDSNSCANCEVGKWSANHGATQCKICSPSTTNPQSVYVWERTANNLCSYWSMEGCIPVPSGQYLDEWFTVWVVHSGVGRTVYNGKCGFCEIGYYNPVQGQSFCQLCPVGKHSLTSGLSVCPNCPVGKYKDQQNSYPCDHCSEGMYSANSGASVCLKCPDGKFNTEMGLSLCFDCARGSYSNGLKRGWLNQYGCDPCDEGHFQDLGGRSACKECPSGYFTTGMGSVGSNFCTLCSAGKYYEKVVVDSYYTAIGCGNCRWGMISSSGQSFCSLCPAGKFNLAGGNSFCTDCTAGKYALSEWNILEKFVVCQDCSSGTFNSLSGQSVCSLCAPGLFNPVAGNSFCSDCAAGKYSLSGQAECHDCSSGTFTNLSRQTVCSLCAPGMFNPVAGGSVCSDCAAGKYSLSGQAECHDCSSGTFTSLLRQTICSLCAPGMFNPVAGQTVCLFCAVGHYSSGSGSSFCESCPVGTFHSHTGSISVSNCSNCSLGTFSSPPGQSACQNCTAGRFTSVVGQSACLLCRSGTFSFEVTATSCLNCPSGMFSPSPGSVLCTNCSSGMFNAVPGQSVCQNCVLGTFNSLQAQTVCSVCHSGTFASRLGQVLCLNCSAGQFSSGVGQTLCLSCSAGMYNSVPQQSTCHLCSSGTFSSTIGSSRIENCVNCSRGTFSPHLGARTHANCSNCSVGMFNPLTGQTVCQVCSPGRYSSHVMASNCTSCPSGKFNPRNGSISLLNCSDCAAGSFNALLAQESCRNCSAGWFSPLSGSTSCLICGSGKFSAEPMATVCRDCSAGFSAWANRSTNCTPCEPGTFSRQSSASLCLQCARGTYSVHAVSTECLLCTRDSYASSLGMTACVLCPPGKAGAALGQTNISDCQICAEGAFSSFGTACVLCSRGSYASAARALECIPCESGKFGSTMGQVAASDCRNCLAGTFASMSGSPLCNDCPAGSYSSLPAMSHCLSCSSGPYSTALAWCPLHTSAPSLIISIYQCTAVAGFYGNPGSPAVECPYDYYCPVSSVTPIPCPRGHTTSGLRSFAASHCTPWMAIPCRPGFYMDFSFYMNLSSTPFCSPCPMGSYCPGHSAIVSCISSTSFYYSRPLSTVASDCVTNPATPSASLSCPVNTHPATAVISLMQCQANAGYYYMPGSVAAANVCPSQYYCPFKAVAPVPCPSIAAVCQTGQYPTAFRCPSTGMAAPLDACQSCLGLPNNAAWASNTDRNCPFCCDAFFYHFGNGACTRHPNTSSCPEDQFMPIPSTCATGLRICTLCPPSTDPELRFLNATHRNSFIRDSEALAFGQCFSGCAPGYFGSYQASQSKTSCIECGPGFYKDYSGDAASCIFCEEGKFASASRASGCLSCPLFSISNAQRTGCICMAGTFPATRANGSLACDVCPSGSISEAGDSTCRTCSAGFVCRRQCPFPCLAGEFGFCLEDGSRHCTPCAAGTFSRESGQSSPNTCTPCTAGTFSSRGAKVCTPCAAGHSANANGSQQCLPCQAGAFGPTTGLTVCAACSGGTFAASVGASVCTACSAGTFSSALGGTHAGICRGCQAGTFATAVGNRQICRELTWLFRNNATGLYYLNFPTPQATVRNYGTRIHTAWSKLRFHSRLEYGSTSLQMFVLDLGRPRPLTPCSSSSTVDATYASRPATDGNFVDFGSVSVCGSIREEISVSMVGTPFSLSSAASDWSLAWCSTATSDYYTCSSAQTCVLSVFGNCGLGSWRGMVYMHNRTEYLADIQAACSMFGNSSRLQCLGNESHCTQPCITCPAGTFSAAAGSTVCTQCAAGKFSTGSGAVAEGTCQPCLAGMYAAFAASTTCKSCPANSWSIMESKKCTANAGFYNLDDNLRAYYPFNEGAFLTDVSGVTGNLVASPNPPTQQASGPFGEGSFSAYTNASMSQFFTLPSMSLPDDTSICSWFWISSSMARSWQRIWDFGAGAPYNNIVASVNADTNDLMFRVYRLTALIGSFSIPNGAESNNTWRHLCMIISLAEDWPKSTMTAWLDGNTSSITMSQRKVRTMTLTLNFIGRSNWPGDPTWWGAFDEFRIYNKALTATEVAGLNAFRGDTATPMIILACPHPCPAGTFGGCLGNGHQNCFACAVGTFSTGTGQTSPNVCSSCAAGTFSTALGANSSATCSACQPGTFSSAMGLATCFACQPGTYAPIRASACTHCPANSWAHAQQSHRCTANVGFYNLDDSLRAYYPFNEGNFLADITGLTGDLVASPSPPTAHASGPFGASSHSAFFTGTSKQFFTLPSLTLPDAVSVCSWFWISPSIVRNWNKIWDFGNGGGSSNIAAGIFHQGNHLIFDVYRGGTFIAHNSLINGAQATSMWRHVCMTLSGTSMVVWLDSTSTSYNMTNVRNPAVRLDSNFIGNSNWVVEPWWGAVDDFRIYHKALTAAEVAALYTLTGDTMIILACPHPCPAGFFGGCLADGAQNCSACAAGTFSSGTGLTSSTACSSFCAAGTFSSAAASVCSSCSSGTFSTALGANTSAACSACSAGQFSLSGSTACTNCSTCTIGQYNVSNCHPAANIVCGACASPLARSSHANRFTFTGAGSNGERSCPWHCNGGLFYDSLDCLVCRQNVWCLYNISYVCPANSGHSASYVSTQSTCRCNSGYVGVGGWNSTTPLLPGQIQPPANWSGVNCVACPAGTFTTAPGSLTCIACAAGTFSTETGQTSPDACSSCPAGTFSTALGANTSATCSDCQAGTFSTAPGSLTCIACAAGRFSAKTGQTNPDACSSCPAGTFSTALGANTSATCSDCQAGTFSTAPGSLTCIACAAGTFSTGLGANTSAMCSDCRPGTFSSGLGSFICMSCAAGTFSSSAAINCSSCAAGTFSTGIGLTIPDACSSCAAGTFSTALGANTSATCSGCRPGTFSSGLGSFTCIACAAGQFQSSVGFSACNNCSRGTFASGVSNSICTFCPAGKMQNSAGSSTCSDCIGIQVTGLIYTDVLGFNIYRFLQNGSLRFTQDFNASVLVVGGGGAGTMYGGGGGAGSVIFSSEITFPANITQNVIVGKGGAYNEVDSVALPGQASSIGNMLTAEGGGADTFRTRIGGGSSHGVFKKKMIYFFGGANSGTQFRSEGGGAGAGGNGSNGLTEGACPASTTVCGPGGQGIMAIEDNGITFDFTQVFGNAYTSVAILNFIAGGGAGSIIFGICASCSGGSGGGGNSGKNTITAGAPNTGSGGGGGTRIVIAGLPFTLHGMPGGDGLVLVKVNNENICP